MIHKASARAPTILQGSKLRAPAGRPNASGHFRRHFASAADHVVSAQVEQKMEKAEKLKFEALAFREGPALH